MPVSIYHLHSLYNPKYPCNAMFTMMGTSSNSGPSALGPAKSAILPPITATLPTSYSQTFHLIKVKCSSCAAQHNNLIWPQNSRHPTPTKRAQQTYQYVLHTYIVCKNIGTEHRHTHSTPTNPRAHCAHYVRHACAHSRRNEFLTGIAGVLCCCCRRCHRSLSSPPLSSSLFPCLGSFYRESRASYVRAFLAKSVFKCTCYPYAFAIRHPFI